MRFKYMHLRRAVHKIRRTFGEVLTLNISSNLIYNILLLTILIIRNIDNMPYERSHSLYQTNKKYKNESQHVLFI